MDKDKILKLIEVGYSQRDLANEFNTSQSNIKYWLKKYEIKTKYKIHNKDKYLINDGKFCPKCEKMKDTSDFYKRFTKDRDGLAGYCKYCSNDYHGNRLKEIKIKMITYKGGKCVDCELNHKDTHYCVFDFHHLDPKTKDPNFNRIKYQNWDKIKEEIDKCVLLCSNCHRLRHSLIGGW